MTFDERGWKEVVGTEQGKTKTRISEAIPTENRGDPGWEQKKSAKIAANRTWLLPGLKIS